MSFHSNTLSVLVVLKRLLVILERIAVAHIYSFCFLLVDLCLGLVYSCIPPGLLHVLLAPLLGLGALPI